VNPEYSEHNTESSEKCSEHQIFGIASASNLLERAASAYNALVIDKQLVRRLLRVLRKRKFRSNRTAAEAAGLSAFTVAKVENLKTWPDYDPGIGIVLKLLGALEMPFRAFATELHALDDKFDSLKPSGDGHVGAAPTPMPRPAADTVDRDEGLPPLPSEAELEPIVLRILARQAVEGRERADQAYREQAANPRPQTPARPDHHRARPRRHAQRKKARGSQRKER